MPAKSKVCEECGIKLILKITRDFTRKRFCSKRCLGLWTGKNRSSEQMLKMWQAGCRPEINKKKAHHGSNHPLWKGGYKNIKHPRKSYELSKWRKEVFERDNYICQLCGERGGKLNADHIKPWSLYPKLRLDITNGRTLCEKCHKNTDTYGLKFWNRVRRGQYAIAE